MVGKKGGEASPSWQATQDEQSCQVKYFDTRILVLIESITNLTPSKFKIKNENIKYPVDVSFKLTLGEEIIGTSDNFSIANTEKHDIDYKLIYTLPSDASYVLASFPLLVSVLGPGGKDKGSRKYSSKSAKGKLSKSSLAATADNVLAEASVDLLPLVLGETEMVERVCDMLEVVVRLDGAKLTVPANLLYTTVQCLYNPPSELLASEVASVSLNVDLFPSSVDTKPFEKKTEDWSRMKFGLGTVDSSDGGAQESAKRWFSIETGPPSLSQYRNILGSERTKDAAKLASKSVGKSNVWIKWNKIKRLLLGQNEEAVLKKKMKEDSEWLVEVFVKKVEEKKGKQKAKKGEIKTAALEKEEDEEVVVYVGRLDVSDLLRPGINCSRVVAQLQYNADASCGTVNLDGGATVPPYKHQTVSKMKEKQSSYQSTQAIVDVEPKEDVSKPVFDSQGRPTYITVLVELYSSFWPRRSADQLEKSVTEILANKLGNATEGNRNCVSPLEARSKYRTAVRDNLRFLQQQYQDYSAKIGETHPLKKDELTDVFFKESLVESGALVAVKENLNAALDAYLQDTMCDTQLGLCEAYCKLVEEMQNVLDEARNVDVSNAAVQVTCDELLETATLASEEANYKQAQNNLFKRLHYYGTKDADKWLDVAVISLRHGDRGRAKEALSTSLSVRPRHRDALLMLAVLLSAEAMYSEASIIFESLTTFYPRFYKGWLAYFCFFEATENKQGADVCLSLGSICMNDRDREEGNSRRSYWSQQLSIGEADGFIHTAVYLLTLNLYQFAEMCLSQHKMEVGEDTLSHLYYLSVAHHLQHRYADSNRHLKQALSIQWDEEHLWNLMGHNLYKLNELERAQDCYRFVLDNPHPSAEYSLTYYRMGKLMERQGKYEEANKFYLKSATLLPTLHSWLGLAKSSYWLGRLDDVELAAREANRLDERAGVPWAFLALVNYTSCVQPHLARQCLSMALQCGIDDEDVSKEVVRVVELWDELASECGNYKTSRS